MRSDTVKAIAALSLLIVVAAMPVTPNLVLYFLVWHDAVASASIGSTIIGGAASIAAAGVAAKVIAMKTALLIFGVSGVVGIAVA